jgi:hypothetical protein
MKIPTLKALGNIPFSDEPPKIYETYRGQIIVLIMKDRTVVEYNFYNNEMFKTKYTTEQIELCIKEATQNLKLTELLKSLYPNISNVYIFDL